MVETKDRFDNWDKIEIQKQLQEYVKYEKAYSDRKIVAILTETEGNDTWTWYCQSVIIDDEHMNTELTTVLSFEEYEELCFGKVNDKLQVVDSIKVLNEMLHSDSLAEKLQKSICRNLFIST